MSDLTRLNPTPHAIAVYASQPLSPVATQHSLPSRTLPFTWAGLSPAGSHQLCLAHVAVGTRVSSRAPRTEPYGRLSRIRLPPRVCDGKAIARPRMEDNRFWKPGIHQLRHPFPRYPIFLATTPQRASPEVGHMMPEHIQCLTVGRHSVIIEVAADHPPQPFPLIGIGW